MITQLFNYELPYTSAFGSRYVLDTQGDTVEELLQNAVITELTAIGNPVGHCHLTECPGELATIAEREIKRIFGGQA